MVAIVAENIVVCGVQLWRTSREKAQKNSVSYIDVQDLRAQSRSFESIAAYKNERDSDWHRHRSHLDGVSTGSGSDLVNH